MLGATPPTHYPSIATNIHQPSIATIIIPHHHRPSITITTH
jgi:hypothetical protein